MQPTDSNVLLCCQEAYADIGEMLRYQHQDFGLRSVFSWAIQLWMLMSN